MKFIIFSCLLAMVAAAPFDDDPRHARILVDNRVEPEGGAYSFDFETDNGIKVSQGGEPDTETGAVIKSGQIEHPLPNGELFVLKFVANENGYQPESPYLPVAPAFPHPIPDFVLRQIAFAEQQRAERARQ